MSKRKGPTVAQLLAESQREAERKANLRKLIKCGPTSCAYQNNLDVWAPMFSDCGACGHNGATHVHSPCTLCQFEIRLRKLEGTK